MNKLPALIALTLLTGCASVTTQQVASRNNFQPKFVETTPFSLSSQQKITKPGAPVNIYIEGDGHSWVTKSKVALDPSPRVPVVMKLAALDPAPNVVYLARPCQYSPHDLKTICEHKYWTYARYSAIVIKSIDSAIDQIKQQANAKEVNLIGFSGGATLAILVAATRNDVASIRTVAGNLDLIAMEKHHNTSPLTESLDPISVAYKIRRIPQLHFVGEKDEVVPTIVAQNFVEAAGISKNSIVLVKDATHNKMWDQHWPELYAMSLVKP